MKKSLLIAALLPFAALSVWAVSQVGLTGLFAQNLNHPAGQQVFADLVVALSLAMVWIWRDARARGRNPWPWLAATLAAGSFGPLLYLLTRQPEA